MGYFSRESASDATEQDIKRPYWEKLMAMDGATWLVDISTNKRYQVADLTVDRRPYKPITAITLTGDEVHLSFLRLLKGAL
jgi:hypothetical protein